MRRTQAHLRKNGVKPRRCAGKPHRPLGACERGGGQTSTPSEREIRGAIVALPKGARGVHSRNGTPLL